MQRRDFMAERDFAENLSVIVRAQGNAAVATEIARREGIIRKDAVGGTSADDMAGIGQGLNDSFFSSLQHGGGVFDTVHRRGRRGQLRTRGFIASEPVIAQVVEEGTMIPAVRFTLDADGLTPVKVAALAVASEEAARTAEGMAGLAADLREAITLETDRVFLSMLAEDAGHTGDLSGTPLTDIGTLLSYTNKTGFADYVLVVTPEIAADMATDPANFQDMTPVGGHACGIEVLVSAGCPGMALIDCGAILSGQQQFQASYTTSATINLGTEDEPVRVSLFQVDAIGVSGTRHFAAKTIRASGVAMLFPETT